VTPLSENPSNSFKNHLIVLKTGGKIFIKWLVIISKYPFKYLNSEERNLSTFAVTLFRHQAELNGKKLEIGNGFMSVFNCL